jgi:hypothetical protein
MLAGVGPVATFFVTLLGLVAALWVGRFLYELAADGDDVGESFRDSSEWLGALAGAVVGVLALALVEGVEVVGVFVDFVGGHALGAVAAALTALSAALAEGLVSMSGTTVVGVAIALTGFAMLSTRWRDEW